MSKTIELTKRQQAWLKEIEACDKQGCSAKEYADKHGLSLSGFYNARCVLKKKGAWSGAKPEPAPSASSEADKPATRFQRVMVQPTSTMPRVSAAQPEQATTPCRLHLPNGVMLEVMTGTDGVALATVVAAAGAWT